MTSDNAFSKTWKTPCKFCCKETPNIKLFFREMCNECSLTLYKEAINYVKKIKNDYR